MKPIKIFYSELSHRFYASSSYRQDKKNPTVYVITGSKTDVTNDIGALIKHYDIEFTERKQSQGEKKS